MRLSKIILIIMMAVVAVWAEQPRQPYLRIGGKDDPSVYLQSLDIQVEVTGNIASTRYTMVFRNKTNRELEGELTFPLPDGRTVTRYALDINGKMREAVPVEKARATQVFEEIQQRQVDPGLLERVEGNNFRTRIYPFPRNGTRTISIGYEEELPLENGLLQYRLPMAYADPIEKFSVTATVLMSELKPVVPEDEDMIRFDRAGENYVATFARENHRPSRALNFALPAPANIPRVMMQSAQGSYYFLASVAPEAETRKKRWRSELSIIWDVSLSGSQRDLRREIEALNVIFSEKRDARVHLYFLNNRFRKIANRGAANGSYSVRNGNWDELRRVLEAAVFDGGTDFSQIKLSGIAGNEILFFSDGISTLSDADFIKNADVRRPIHCVVSSPNADYGAMRLIAGKSRGKFININALSPEQLRSELLNETLQFLGVERGNAVGEVYPGIATPVRGSFSVAGISGGANAELTLLFGYGNTVEKRVRVQLNANKAARMGSVHRIWAQKKIAELDLDYDRHREELTELGKQFGIVTRNTSLIVLELMSDYVRFGIEPPADLDENLLAEYQRLLKGNLERRRGAERDMIERAAVTAGHLAKWWGTAPSAPKYPVPDGDSPAPRHPTPDSDTRHSDIRRGGGEFDIDMLYGHGGEIVTRTEPPPPPPQSAPAAKASPRPPQRQTQAEAPSLSRQKSAPAPKSSRKSSSSDRGGASKAFAFESAEVIGYLDNPTPVYIVDMDSPDADPVTLDRSFRDMIRSGGSDHGYDMLIIRDSVANARRMADARVRDSIWRAEEPARRVRDSIWRVEDSLWRAGQRRVRDSIDAARRTRDSIDFFAKEKYYMLRLTGKLDEDYQTYLTLRNDHSNSPHFYFDMADWFYRRGDRETALRILTSIAEIGLENAPRYRMLGYRLKEYGEYALLKFVCRKVLEWRPIEPQSYRDYALALADNGEEQAALDSLYSALTREYSQNIYDRNRGIEDILIMEINRLISKNPNLDASRIDSRLVMDIPVDIRVVLNWNMDNIDIDLYAIGPDYSEIPPDRHYGPRDYRGWRIIKRLTNVGGYGPEQLSLKNAARGRYRFYARYMSRREFASADPVAVSAEIYTKYAGGSERRRVVNLELREKGLWSRVDIAEIEF